MRFTYGLKQVINNFALDYEGSRFTQALADGQNRYLIFEGRLTGIKNHVDIPRGERFGGQHTDNLPCTLNDFTACCSDEILPGYRIPYKQERYPEYGSTISIAENGVKGEMLMFDEEKLQFVPYKNKEQKGFKDGY